MAADPALDRIAAAMEEGVTEAGPHSRAVMSEITVRYIDDLLKVYAGPPDELGAALLSMYAKFTKMVDWMGPSAASRAHSFFLANAGTQLYLRHHPAPHSHAEPARTAELLVTSGESGPWLICRTCVGDDQIVAGFGDRVPIENVLDAACDHSHRLHSGKR